MEKTRLDDMLERYGEVCTQREAGKILGINPRTVYTMLTDGRLRRIAHGVDVRSICEYLEQPYQNDLTARMVRRAMNGPTVSDGEFFAAARNGRWAPKR